MEVPGVKILHYCGGLNFASRQHFRKQVYQTAGVVPQMELALRLKNSEKENAESTNKVNVVTLCKDMVKNLTSSHEWKRQHSTCPMVILVGFVKKTTIPLRYLMLCYVFFKSWAFHKFPLYCQREEKKL